MNHRWKDNVCIHCGVKRTKKTFRLLMAIVNHPPWDVYNYEQRYVYEDGEETYTTRKSCTHLNHTKIYNAKYNFEPALIRVKDHKPAFVQFIDNSSIYKPEGILLSSVQLLLPEQQL